VDDEALIVVLTASWLEDLGCEVETAFNGSQALTKLWNDRQRKHGSAIGTGTAVDMLGVFAEFETNLRRERQLEGIAKAKAAGVYRGRKPSIDQAQVEKLKAEGLGATEIAKRLSIGRASVYRVLAS
jgi:hypothetical protein